MSLAKKITFIIVVNLVFLTLLEISSKIFLRIINKPLLYSVENINTNRYDFLTGYFNSPNQDEFFFNNKHYKQAIDNYGFNIDGNKKPKNLLLKNKNEFRIFILGGSTVQGRNLLDRFDPISARIEKKLNENLGYLKNFNVFNTGSGGFISSQELSLIQYRINYSLKPDLIIILNGSNDATSRFSETFYLSNSHPYQENFQKNLEKNSKNLFYFIDDWFSKNYSTYFLLKKTIEKITGTYLFDKKSRSYFETSLNSLEITENKSYRYLYNMKILKNISNKKTPIFLFLQPQMLTENYKDLSSNDKYIYDNKKKINPNYFNRKELFYKSIIEKINTNNLDEGNDNFKFFDLSKILDTNKEHSMYSDHVHYTPFSREQISDHIYSEVYKYFMNTINK